MKIIFYITTTLAIIGAVLLQLTYQAYQTAPSSSRGFILFVPFLSAPVIVGILIWLCISLAKIWKELNNYQRIFGIAAPIPIVVIWLRFAEHF